METRAVVAERSLAAKSAEFEDVTVRCAVFEAQLRASEEQAASKCAALAEELAVVVDKLQASEKASSKQRRQGLQRSASQLEEKYVDGGNAEPQDQLVSSWLCIPPATPLKHNDAAVLNGVEASVATTTVTLSHAAAVAELRQRRINETRLRRALNACRLADLALDTADCERSSTAQMLAACHAAATQHLRDVRRAASCARVVQLSPVTLRVAKPGTSASTGGLHRAIVMVRQQLDALTPLPPPIAVLHAPEGSVLDRSALEMISVVGPALHHALALEHVTFN
jgi:hypothetical protein